MRVGRRGVWILLVALIIPLGYVGLRLAPRLWVALAYEEATIREDTTVGWCPSRVDRVALRKRTFWLPGAEYILPVQCYDCQEEHHDSCDGASTRYKTVDGEPLGIHACQCPNPDDVEPSP